jgi:hypothetical protein
MLRRAGSIPNELNNSSRCKVPSTRQSSFGIPIKRAALLPSSIAPDSIKWLKRRLLMKNNRSQLRIDCDGES